MVINKEITCNNFKVIADISKNSNFGFLRKKNIKKTNKGTNKGK